MPSAQRHKTLDQTYGERSEDPDLTPLATYLLRLIHTKRTNLCVSADVSTTSELLQLAEDVGDHICVLKTHADIISDFTDKTARGLIDVSRRRKFIIFEDRKFGDIGNTVQQQYTSGSLAIVRWAPIVNAHLFPGPAIITALRDGARKAIAAHNTSVQTDISAEPATPMSISSIDDEPTNGEHEHDLDDAASDASDPIDEYINDERSGRKQSIVSVSTTISTQTETISPRPSLHPSLSRGSTGSNHDDDDDDHDDDLSEQDLAAALEDLGPPPFYRSLLLLAQMSSKDNFLTADYTDACVHHARANRDFVMGFIAQRSLNVDPKDNFITMTPGVQLAAGGDAMGQQYSTPGKIVTEAGSDVIIVGRGVLGAQDRRQAAQEYRKQGWAAYEERLRVGRRRRGR